MAEKVVPQYQRTESVQPASSLPGMGRQYSSVSNPGIMATIGSRVAQTASQAIATQLGTEAGKNPHGELFPAFTDFDKTFEANYKTQAQATLSLQADKLISESEIQLADAHKLTPDLIKNTQAQVAQGLARIASFAPQGVRENLQNNFAQQMISNNQRYQIHMINQQREQQKSNLAAGLDLYSNNILNLGAAGNDAGSKGYVEQIKQSVHASVASELMSPLEAKRRIDTAEQNYLNGKYIFQAVNAQNQGKYSEWAKNFAKNPDKLPLDKFYNAGNAAQSQVNFIQGLNSQDDQLRAAQMRNSIAMDAKGISQGNWDNFESNVSNPRIVEEVKHAYIQAIKAADKQQKMTQDLINGFSDPNVIARSSSKDVNAAFDTLVGKAVDTAEKKGIPLTKEQAEVQVANSAGGPVPAFQNSLRNKLSSGNAQQIESAAQQIHQLNEMEGGHALNGLGAQPLAAAAKYEALRGQLADPTEAAREMNNAVYNQDPLVHQAIQEKWSNIISQQTKAGLTREQIAFTLVGTNKDRFQNPGAASMAAGTILETYNTYFTASGGDQQAAKKLTQQFYKENFGETSVNGKSGVTLHPIEKALGYKTDDVVPYIHEDLANQLNKNFAPIKKAFDEGKAHEYWEVIPQEKPKTNPFMPWQTDYKPLKVKRHLQRGKTNEFDVVLQGSSFNSWDVAVNSESGLRNLFQIAPYLGITSYQPNKKAISDAYNKDHH